jgi:hypothetical protein
MLSRSRWWLACLALAWAAVPALAQAPPDPLRLVPAEADLVVKVENPSHLVQSLYNLEAIQGLQKIDAVRELYDSTNVRRFNQLVGYFEKKLGADKFQLLDKLAGGGVVLALKIANPPLAMAVIQGRDEKTTRDFVAEMLEIAQLEMERQDIKQKISRQTYEGIETVSVGKDAHFAVVGAAVVLANKPEVLKASLDLHLGKGKQAVTTNPTLAEARKLLPKDPAAWAWVNMDSVRKIPQAKEFFDQFYNQAIFNLYFVGPMVDLARRSPYACAGYYQQGNRFTWTLRFPRGMNGMPDTVAAFFPKGQGSSPKLLEPPNVVSSTSYYLNLGELWENRKKLLKANELKNLEQFEQNSGRFMGGVKIGDLAKYIGPHQRLVVTQPTESVYKKKPSVTIQAYGLIQETRDPAFGKHMDRMLRTVAILGAAQFNLKMIEEKHGDITLVTYRFPEDRPLPRIASDEQNIRFGFSPCFAQVGNQFFVASTVELGRNLIKTLQHEQQTGTSNAMMRSKVYASGLAETLRGTKDQIVAQFALTQALPIEQARKQVDTLIELVQNMGWAEMETHYGQDDFRMDIVVELKK